MNDQKIINHITNALKLANISIALGLLAVLSFLLFGTLASLNIFHADTAVYYAFHYLPYLLICFSIPISIYHAFLLMRYRIIDSVILLLVMCVGFLLPLFAVVSWLTSLNPINSFMSLFLAMIAWFSMPFLFRVNLIKFQNFLQENINQDKL